MRIPIKKHWDGLGRFSRLFDFFLQLADPPALDEKGSLAYWRELILFAIYLSGATLAIIVFIPSFLMVFSERLWLMVFLNLTAFSGAIVFVLYRRIRFQIRVGFALLMTYGIGVGVIFSVGLLSGGPAWLFAFAVMAAILLGLRAAFFALGLNAVTVLLFGWLMATGRFGQSFPFFQSMGKAVTAGANFLFMNSVIALSVAVLAKGLASAYQKEKSLHAALQEEQSRLKDSKARLEIEIEERIKAEELIKTSLLEKEVLLSEVHHRVKNNMQVIISLLNLQSSREENEIVLEALRLTRNRISAMSLVHESLYKSESMAEINLCNYLNGLIKTLTISYGIHDRKIVLDIAVEKEILVGLNRAVPCGLVLNELISNSFKHAFPHGLDGCIKIMARKIDKNIMEIIVSDNGVGLPLDFDRSLVKTLGLSIVNILVEKQCGGKIEMIRDRGTTTRMTIPLNTSGN